MEVLLLTCTCITNTHLDSEQQITKVMEKDLDKDHQQYSLSLVVNSGTIDLASKLLTNGLVKQQNFTKIPTTKLVKHMKNRNMIGFVIFTCHVFYYIILGQIYFFILWFSLIFRCLKAGLVPCQGYKLMVPDSTTTGYEYCWWFLIRSKIFSFPHISRFQHNEILHVGLVRKKINCAKQLNIWVILDDHIGYFKLAHWTVWYKTKVSSQNFGHQQWWSFVHGFPKLVLIFIGVSRLLKNVTG